MIYLGADHAGFKLKEKIKQYFEKHSISYADLGAQDFDKDDDYTDYAVMVAKKVSLEPKARGILICGTGNGMAMAANKIKSVRAALAWDVYSAEKATEDDHANIITLPARDISHRRAIKVIKAYLDAKPSKASSHIRRINKIKKLEK
ncbi:ribose-5-phosphate isomerase [bacterium]|jgi:ribose 5-phosphate isomerase B|nr:ribose-5-phosphate isomerase [bacterium]MDP6571423.1 RpiB/LacA/LacB family sugar-phosphate isomerase [Patescibacteria group bacterium]MDP6756390.1 RpiB/LacA/LacB family sugar-phosphate isomerase [Patescibacteria group bacterium]|tara:strand:+ start:10763 stop:11203 length:441 start_codon:yes stop_codon:yes gene_type:complete